MIIPEELIDHLEHEINIGNVDKKVQNLILIISEENQKLKKQLEIKHDGFMASVEESCELAKENQELRNQKQEWIDLLNMFKTQQKEFIEWLESKNFLGQIPVEQVFSKYKEIIGDK